jgi:hypothetical protein
VSSLGFLSSAGASVFLSSVAAASVVSFESGYGVSSFLSSVFSSGFASAVTSSSPPSISINLPFISYLVFCFAYYFYCVLFSTFASAF